MPIEAPSLPVAAVWTGDAIASELLAECLEGEGWKAFACEAFDNLLRVTDQQDVDLLLTHWHDERRNHGRVSELVRRVRDTPGGTLRKPILVGNMHFVDQEHAARKEPREWWPANWRETLALYDVIVSPIYDLETLWRDVAILAAQRTFSVPRP